MEESQQQFQISTWNVGTFRDFVKLNESPRISKYSLKNVNNYDENEWDNFLINHRQKLFEKILKETNSDIYCFQEVGKQQLEEWLGPDYSSISGDGGHTYVAWNTHRFKSICLFPANKQPGRCLYSERFTNVILQDLKTNNLIRVVSIHLSGCENIHESKSDDSWGNKELDAILKSLKSCQFKIVATIIGADANVAKDHPRMKLLLNDNFKLDNQALDTNYNTYLAKNAVEQNWTSAKIQKMEIFRKIDFLAIKAHTDKTVYSTFPKRLEGTHLTPLGDPRNNPSDHSMVVRTITIKE